jgi:hypothetical protein
MRKLDTLVIVGFFAAAMSCGSGGETSTTPTAGHSGGGTTAAGGSGGSSTKAAGGSTGTPAGGSGGSSTTAAGGSSGNGSASCPLPSCLRDLSPDCAGSGTCSVLTDLDTGSANFCFANGVVEIVVHDVMTDDRTMTAQKNGSTCFSTAYNGNDVYSGIAAITVKNASGATVASVRIDDTDNLYKVTCTGSQEVTLDQSCSSVWPVSALMASIGSSCEEGDCTP